MFGAMLLKLRSSEPRGSIEYLGVRGREERGRDQGAPWAGLLASPSFCNCCLPLSLVFCTLLHRHRLLMRV